MDEVIYIICVHFNWCKICWLNNVLILMNLHLNVCWISQIAWQICMNVNKLHVSWIWQCITIVFQMVMSWNIFWKRTTSILPQPMPDMGKYFKPNISVHDIWSVTYHQATSFNSSLHKHKKSKYFNYAVLNSKNCSWLTLQGNYCKFDDECLTSMPIIFQS